MLTDDLQAPLIVVVEDDESHVELITRSFQDAGDEFRLRVSSTLSEARLLIGRDTPSLVFSDMHLPDGDGSSLITSVKYTCPVVIMTALGSERLAADAIKTGAFDYLVKSAESFAALPLIARHAMDDWMAKQERLRAFDATRRARREWEQTFNAVPDLIAIIDSRNTIIRANRALAERLGIPAGELAGKQCCGLIHGLPAPPFNCPHSRMMQEGREQSEVVFEQRLGGIFDVTVSPLFDSHGVLSACVHVMRDITERKQREEALLVSAAKFRAVLDNAADAVVLIDPDGRCVYANQEACRLTGYPQTGLLGREVASLVMAGSRDEVMAEFRKLEPGKSTLVEVPVRCRQGEQVAVDLNLVLLPDGNVYASCRDVSRRRQIELLVRMRLKLRDCALTEGMDELMRCVVEAALELSGSMSGQLLEADEEQHRLVPRAHVFRDGLQAAFENNRELLAPGWSGIFEDCVRSRQVVISSEGAGPAMGRRALGEAASGGQLAAPFVINDRVTGILWISGKETPYTRDDLFVISQFVIFACEVIERKKAELGRYEFERQFQRSQKLESLGVLAGGIAHDFSNILNIINGHCQEAREELNGDGASGMRHIQQIEEAVGRAAGLCRQMLAYAGRYPLQRTETGLGELIDGTVTLLRSAFGKHVTIKLDPGSELPPVLADYVQIQQVVMNLLINAAEAIGDDHGLISISLGRETFTSGQTVGSMLGSALQPGDYIRLEISDTGCGMDEATQQKIFEPFFSTKVSGRGLGMTAVLGVIKSHDGALRFTSEPGKGTIFTLYFPLPGTGASSREAAQERFSGGTVLLVDDDEALLAVGSALLSAMGYRSITAKNGREALEMALDRDSQPDLVMMDLSMPEMDGLEAYRKLRLIDTRIPVIICSGFDETLICNGIAGDSRACFLEKPYKPNTLRKILRDLLQKGREV